MDTENHQILSEKTVELLQKKRALSEDITAHFCTTGRSPNEVYIQHKNPDGSEAYCKIITLGADGSRDKDKPIRRDRSNVQTVPFNATCLHLTSGKDCALIITEGEFDAMACMEAGFDAVISNPDGAPSKAGEGQIDPENDAKFSWLWKNGELDPEIDKFDQIILAVDNDAPGRILREELAIRLNPSRCYAVDFGDFKDANDCLIKAGEQELLKILDNPKPLVPDETTWLKDVPCGRDFNPLSLGIDGLDTEILQGDLVVITGTPNSGKSLFARIVTAHIAYAHKQKGTIIQFEDRDITVAKSLQKFYLGRNFQKGMPVQEKTKQDAIEWAGNNFRVKTYAHCDRGAYRDLDWLLKVMEMDVKRYGIKWFLIDPWNQIEHRYNSKQTSETSYMEQAFKRINAFRKTNNVTVFIVTHPDKDSGKSKSFEDFGLYDISGGAHWNNAPDVGIVISRKKEGSDYTNISQIKTCKVREQEMRGAPQSGEWTCSTKIMKYLNT